MTSCASNDWPVPSGWSSVVTSISPIESTVTETPNEPMSSKDSTNAAWFSLIVSHQSVCAANSAPDFTPTLPAGFQKSEEASSVLETNAPAMAAARGPTGIFRNCAPAVPMFGFCALV